METNSTLKTFLLYLLLQFLVTAVESSFGFDPFMDSKLFSIKWYGPLELNREQYQSHPVSGHFGNSWKECLFEGYGLMIDSANKNVQLAYQVELLGDRHVMITTNHKERYRCILPDVLNEEEDESKSFKGPTADDLMRPLFKQSHCSYRIESYWTYELCHGKHLKQYHETKEQGVQPRVQEYYLGFGNDRDILKEEDKATVDTDSAVPVREVEGVELPYYKVTMGDGTQCDLTGQPRKAHVLYVCQPEGRGEIYELKESSTCEYEIIVLSSLLCQHPQYRPKSKPVSEIRCHAMYGSPLKPSQLSQVEYDTRYLQTAGHDYVTQGTVTDDDDDDIHEKRKPKFHRNKETAQEVPPKAEDEQQAQLGTLTDKQTLQNILTGSQCLRGGSGWWRHEVCFGKKAKQFHPEKGKEINIYLGYWNKEKHIAWLKDNPQKRPRPAAERKLVSHFYSGGDVCDLTGKARDCEVRIKCLQNIKNRHAVVLSLAEPEPCHYVLTVESALFCSILKDADDNGLFDPLVV